MIVEKIIQISAVRSLGAKDAIDKLVGDIATQYDEKLGFEAERNREKAKRDQLTQEISILKEDKRLLDVEYSAKREALISLQEINRLGIANAEVVKCEVSSPARGRTSPHSERIWMNLVGSRATWRARVQTIKDLEADEAILTESITSKKEHLNSSTTYS